MIHHAINPRLFTLLVVGLAICADARQNPSVTPPESAPIAGAAVSEWDGKVQLQLPGRSLGTPVRGQVLPPGTLLDTGNGKLLLRMDDGSQILVRPQTRLILKQPAASDGNYLQLLLGRIRAQIKKRTGGAPSFQLGTPSAVIAVRGTRFDVEVNQRRVTEVDVFEGLVEVAGNNAARQSVLLQPGFSTRVGMDMSPEPPVRTEEIRPELERPDRDVESEEEDEHEKVQELDSPSRRHELQESEEELEAEGELTDRGEVKEPNEHPGPK
jgi:hypothetical protein